MENTLSLRINSVADEIYRVEEFIDAIKQKWELPEDVYGNAMICVTEAVNNAINHGNKNDPQKNVTVNAEKMDDRIKVRVSDEGDGFDPSELPDPLAAENLLKNSGRGVFIMEQMADETNYINNGSTVELTFRL